MTVQNISGMSGLYLPDIHPLVQAGYLPSAASDITLDAGNEECIFVGRVWLSTRVGTKTISAAGGGSIWWMPGASTTFADAGTTCRVALQDLDTATGPPARGDGTDDVYADLVGGTDTITSITFRDTAMGTGTKDITHGQLVALSIRLTARGGADSLKVRPITGAGATISSAAGLLPTVTSFLASAYATVNAVPLAILEFDDGTLGFFDGSWVSSTGALVTARAYNTGSTPDERGNRIYVTGPINIDALWCKMFTASAAADFELCLYSDPLGTPSLIEAIAIDANAIGSAAGPRMAIATLGTVRALSANTAYGITLRPTTANNVSAYEHDVAATTHWVAHPMGAECYQITRSDNSGAFTGSTTSRILCGVRACGIDDGTGGSGGGILMPNKRANMQ